jgi:hypothetical protein
VRGEKEEKWEGGGSKEKLKVLSTTLYTCSFMLEDLGSYGWDFIREVTQ